jgi:ubiquinone/menaquinone biosynthesis C-methylase UbiE
VTNQVQPRKGPSLADDNEGLARDYDAVSAPAVSFVSGQRLVEALAVAPGERVIDVGRGTVFLAEHIAGIAGPAGHVLDIDPLTLCLTRRVRSVSSRACARRWADRYWRWRQ